MLMAISLYARNTGTVQELFSDFQWGRHVELQKLIATVCFKFWCFRVYQSIKSVIVRSKLPFYIELQWRKPDVVVLLTS